MRITASQWSGFLLLAISAMSSAAESSGIPEPRPNDTCPVCGMFVAKYPEWIATVAYKDGHAHHFDGAKDMYKYLYEMPRWAPGHKAEDITSIQVTEYYGLTRIDARSAWYVIGSDVLGPMGHELIPLETRADAEELLRDHSGKGIVRFDDVSPALPTKLDAGKFD